jgi:hypothetical protein
MGCMDRLPPPGKLVTEGWQERDTPTTWHPAFAKARAQACPRPLDAPVTNTWGPYIFFIEVPSSKYFKFLIYYITFILKNKKKYINRLLCPYTIGEG